MAAASVRLSPNRKTPTRVPGSRWSRRYACHIEEAPQEEGQIGLMTDVNPDEQ